MPNIVDYTAIEAVTKTRREAAKEWRAALKTIIDIIDEGDRLTLAIEDEVAAQARYRAAAAEEDRVRGEMVTQREEAVL